VVSSSLKQRFAIAAFFAALATSNPASADEVDRCVAASEKGQKERRAGNLMEARSAFLQCAGEKCPSVVKAACTEWLDQVTAALPTIVVAVTDPDRKDIVDARILVDGKAVALGRAVPLDPGPHSISVEADGFESATQSIVARESEHNRSVSFALAKKSDAPPAHSSSEQRGIRPITWITGGLAVAALASFTGFGLRGRFLAADLRDTCAPSCSESDRDRAHTSYVIADISLIAAVVLGGISVVTYFVNRD
jgi:hypothetical protein